MHHLVRFFEHYSGIIMCLKGFGCIKYVGMSYLINACLCNVNITLFVLFDWATMIHFTHQTFVFCYTQESTSRRVSVKS